MSETAAFSPSVRLLYLRRLSGLRHAVMASRDKRSGNAIPDNAPRLHKAARIPAAFKLSAHARAVGKLLA
jgi:hypothetical protein